MIDKLKNQWHQLAVNYTNDSNLIDSLWNEIEKQYTLKIRHYHNFSHISSMLHQAENFKSSIVNYDAFLLSIWYHDAIYKPTKKDNEEKSAILAQKRLKTLNIDEKTLEIIQKLIISTKKHEIVLSNNDDNALLLDIDLSILGSDWKTYQNYIENIRKEYAIYPNFMYKKGRKQVLMHFLERKTLFFTDIYKEKHEAQARKNLLKEIKLL
jgi:predicted metal-dependent HD superfamily phosphohydrolase